MSTESVVVDRYRGRHRRRDAGSRAHRGRDAVERTGFVLASQESGRYVRLGISKQAIKHPAPSNVSASRTAMVENRGIRAARVGQDGHGQFDIWFGSSQ